MPVRDRRDGRPAPQPSSQDQGPPYCIEPTFDPEVPEGHIKGRRPGQIDCLVLGRTVYVGGVNAMVTTDNLRKLFETVGRVQTVTVS